jgi:hypothetical protein
VADERKKFILFKVLIAVGFALGIVLLLQTVTTYTYVGGAMLNQEVERESQRKVNTLVGAVRAAQTQDLETIGLILEEFQLEWDQLVAWVRIVDSAGNPLLSAGSAPVGPISMDRLPRPFPGPPPTPETVDTPEGEVLVSVRSFRSTPLGPGGPSSAPSDAPAGAFPSPPPPAPGPQESGSVQPPGPPGAPGASPSPNLTDPQRGTRRGARGRGTRPVFGSNWNVEIAIFTDSISGSFAGLRRNLIIGVSASLTLITALILLAVRFPNYLRSQQIERELDLARRVQADLLPSAETISPYVDFSAQCVSAWQVGGDFCDVFHVSEDRTALVLGDVSGKGISAALLMALIHGAIHSVAWTRSTQDHVNASRQLNSLLCKKTAAERFTSLFWGCFDPQRSAIQFITGGHLPPLLIRKTNGALEVQRLETGGPVMGLLAGVTFQQGEHYIAPGDLLVAFSDGVVEAANEAGEEFGEQRVIDIIQESWDAPATSIRNVIYDRVREFTSGAPVNDDQTIIVVRFKHHAVELPEPRTSAAHTT